MRTDGEMKVWSQSLDPAMQRKFVYLE